MPATGGTGPTNRQLGRGSLEYGIRDNGDERRTWGQIMSSPAQVTRVCPR